MNLLYVNHNIVALTVLFRVIVLLESRSPFPNLHLPINTYQLLILSVLWRLAAILYGELPPPTGLEYESRVYEQKNKI